MRKTNREWHEGETPEERKLRLTEWHVKTEETKAALMRSFPDLDHRTGEALWHCLVNRDVYLPHDDSGYEVGWSFRSWGGLLAELIPGTDYIDYYCNMRRTTEPEFVAEVMGKLVADGWILED